MPSPTDELEALGAKVIYAGPHSTEEPAKPSPTDELEALGAKPVEQGPAPQEAAPRTEVSVPLPGDTPHVPPSWEKRLHDGVTAMSIPGMIERATPALKAMWDAAVEGGKAGFDAQGLAETFNQRDQELDGAHLTYNPAAQALKYGLNGASAFMSALNGAMVGALAAGAAGVKAATGQDKFEGGDAVSQAQAANDFLMSRVPEHAAIPVRGGKFAQLVKTEDGKLDGQVVGGPPTDQDFAKVADNLAAMSGGDAAKIEGNLKRQWEDHGQHPAEVQRAAEMNDNVAHLMATDEGPGGKVVVTPRPTKGFLKTASDMLNRVQRGNQADKIEMLQKVQAASKAGFKDPELMERVFRVSEGDPQYELSDDEQKKAEEHFEPLKTRERDLWEELSKEKFGDQDIEQNNPDYMRRIPLGMGGDIDKLFGQDLATGGPFSMGGRRMPQKTGSLEGRSYFALESATGGVNERQLVYKKGNKLTALGATPIGKLMRRVRTNRAMPPISEAWPLDNSNFINHGDAKSADKPEWFDRAQDLLGQLSANFGLKETPRLHFGDLPEGNDTRGETWLSHNAIVLHSGLDEKQAVTTLVHEFGHRLDSELLSEADPATKASVETAWQRHLDLLQARLKESEGIKLDGDKRWVALSFFRKLDRDAEYMAVFEPEGAGREPSPTRKDFLNYLAARREWFAEQVSKYLSEQYAPRGIAEAFFHGIAQYWRALYSMVTGAAPLEPEVKKLLDGHWTPEFEPSTKDVPHDLENPRLGDTIDAGGDTWTLKTAFTREIEDATELRYYKNAMLVTAHNIVEMQHTLRSVQTLKEIQAMPEFKQFSLPANARNIPASWREPKMPLFKGYRMDPKLAHVIDDFYGKVKSGDDKLADFLDRVNTFALVSLFWSPIPHALNAFETWVPARGLSGWINPVRLGRLGMTLPRAIFEVATLGPKYIEALRDGASLQSANSASENFLKDVLRATGDRIAREPNKFDPIARVLGWGPSDLVASLYRASGTALWRISDVFMMQYKLEQEMMGKGSREAIAKTEEYMHSYRPPIEIFGSRAAKEFLFNRTMFSFMNYHYGNMEILAHMAKALTVGLNGATRLEALDKILGYGLVLFMFGPLVSKAIQGITGNPNLNLPTYGPGKLLQPAAGGAVKAAGENAPDWMNDYFKDDDHTTLNRVVGTIAASPLSTMVLQSFYNQNMFTGKHIVEPSDLRRGKYGRVAGQAAEMAGQTLVQPYGLTAQAMRQNKDLFSAALEQALGVQERTPEMDAKRAKAYHFQDVQAIGRHRHPTGPIESLFSGQ